MEEDTISMAIGTPPRNNSVNINTITPTGSPVIRETPSLLIPRHSFSQLRAQPLSPQLTAARLALSTDIGYLRRNIDESMNTNSNSAGQYPTKKQHSAGLMTGGNQPFLQQQLLLQHPQRQNDEMTQVFQEREQVLSSAALPMSRSFASSRLAAGTVFRPSISATSLSSLPTNNSFCSMKEFDATAVAAASSMEVPGLSMEDEDDCYPSQPMQLVEDEPMPPAELPPVCLEELADDVHIHILQFLDLKDTRTVMATNTRFRKLLFTSGATLLWKDWCRLYNWEQVVASSNAIMMGYEKEVLLVDDLSLPTAARPSTLSLTSAAELSSWHQQANMSVLLSMAQSQPTDIDRKQLSEYMTWKGRGGGRRGSRSLRQIRLAAAVAAGAPAGGAPRPRRVVVNRTTREESRQPPHLQCSFDQEHQNSVVQFIGRVGQGDRCVRSNAPLPRPTLMQSKDASWVVPPSQSGGQGHNSSSGSSRSGHKHHHSFRSSSAAMNTTLLDLFCRNARAVPTPRAAWRPFVAPFVTREMMTAVHLTPRFVSYFEVSILEPKTEGNNMAETATPQSTSSTRPSDCVAVGLATDSFDWHVRMPGWDASSYGYHGDDGGIFHSSGGMLRKFGPSYGRGDVVGCGIDHVAGGIFFTLNGVFLGYAWTGLPQEMLQQDFYPVVGIDTNDFIVTNFGTQPFVYDLKSMIVRHEDLVHQSLSASAASTTSR